MIADSGVIQAASITDKIIIIMSRITIVINSKVPNMEEVWIKLIVLSITEIISLRVIMKDKVI